MIKFLTTKLKEFFMAKEGVSKGQTKGPINQHKAMAEGQKVTGMKKGGVACKKGGAVKKKGK